MKSRIPYSWLPFFTGLIWRKRLPSRLVALRPADAWGDLIRSRAPPAHHFRHGLSTRHAVTGVCSGMSCCRRDRRITHLWRHRWSHSGFRRNGSVSRKPVRAEGLHLPMYGSPCSTSNHTLAKINRFRSCIYALSHTWQHSMWPSMSAEVVAGHEQGPWFVINGNIICLWLDLAVNAKKTTILPM